MNNRNTITQWPRILSVLVLALLVYTIPVRAALKIADDNYQRRVALRKTTVTPNTQNCSHRVGNVHFTITNW